MHWYDMIILWLKLTYKHIYIYTLYFMMLLHLTCMRLMVNICICVWTYTVVLHLSIPHCGFWKVGQIPVECQKYPTLYTIYILPVTHQQTWKFDPSKWEVPRMIIYSPVNKHHHFLGPVLDFQTYLHSPGRASVVSMYHFYVKCLASHLIWWPW